mgnify:CR=1 FL=1
MLTTFRRKKRGSSLAEFGPAMWVFLMVIIIPLIDLFSFMWGVGTVMLASNLCASKAAGSRTYSEAIKAVNEVEDNLAGFRGFAKLSPTDKSPRGVKLQVIANSTSGGPGAPTVYAPPPVADKIPTDRATLDTTLYHYHVTAAYDVQPLFNFSGMEIFSKVPGLGMPVPVVYTSSSIVEHPDGLND